MIICITIELLRPWWRKKGSKLASLCMLRIIRRKLVIVCGILTEIHFVYNDIYDKQIHTPGKSLKFLRYRGWDSTQLNVGGFEVILVVFFLARRKKLCYNGSVILLQVHIV